MIERLAVELTRVGIRGRLKARILAEARDHLAEGSQEQFGDPAELARQFADGVAVDRSRGAAFAAFGALAAAGLAFAAAFLAVASLGHDIASGRWPAPVGVALALGAVFFPQVAFVAGALALLRARRLRGPAAEVTLLLARTRVALVFGALALTAVALLAVDYGAPPWAAALPAAAIAPLAATGWLVHVAAAVRSSVPGDAGDVFDDLPVSLPRRHGLLLLVTAAAASVAMVAAAPNDEGIRNAVVEATLVTAGWLALGRRLALRR